MRDKIYEENCCNTDPDYLEYKLDKLKEKIANIRQKMNKLEEN